MKNTELSEINGISNLKMGSYGNVSYIEDSDDYLRQVNNVLKNTFKSIERCNSLIFTKENIFVEKSLLECLNDCKQTSRFYNGNDVECIKISDITFRKVIFKEYTFRNVIFENCIFDEVYLFDSDISEAVFNNCNIENMLIYKSTFDITNLNDTSIKDIIFFYSKVKLPINGDDKSLIENIFMYHNDITFKSISTTDIKVNNIYSFYDIYDLNKILDLKLLLRNINTYGLFLCRYINIGKHHIIDDTFFERLSDVHINFSKIKFIIYNTAIDLKYLSLLQDILISIDTFEDFCSYDPHLVVYNPIDEFFDKSENCEFIINNILAFLRYLKSHDKYIENRELVYEMSLYSLRHSAHHSSHNV